MTYKLPKQFRHWCEKTFLVPTASGKCKTKWLYLEDASRKYRIGENGELDVSVSLNHFDIWENSIKYSYIVPSSLKAFENLIFVINMQEFVDSGFL